MARADLAGAKKAYPSTGMGQKEWDAVLAARPDIMWQIIADIYNVVKDREDRESGIRRMGRRPRRTSGSMEDVMATVFPQQFTHDLFPEALTKLLGKRSQRAFARRIPVNQGTLSRLLSGRLEPDMQMLEAIAHAARVTPAYFVEWRAMHVGKAITEALLAKPNLGVTAVRRLNAAFWEQAS